VEDSHALADKHVEIVIILDGRAIIVYEIKTNAIHVFEAEAENVEIIGCHQATERSNGEEASVNALKKERMYV